MNKGITLIALVITIIILLILAGIVISLTLNQNGLITIAQQAGKNYLEEQEKELNALNELTDSFYELSGQYDPSLVTLKAGDYVKYDSGENGIILSRVLYEVSSEYGLQIISNESLKSMTLGTKESYNNVVDILNTEALQYLNTDYVKDARSVGTNPKDKNAETLETVKIPQTWHKPSDWESLDSQCKGEDTNYIADWNAIQQANILNNESYWLASRYLDKESDYIDFYVRKAIRANQLDGNYFYGVNSGGGTDTRTNTNGLRACFTLKKNVKVLQGDGKSEATAYTLGL